MTTTQPPRKYGIHLNRETNRLYVGPLTDDRTDLTDDKEDIAVEPVADFILLAYDGALQVDTPDGITYQIEVVKIGRPDPITGMRTGIHPGSMIVGYQPADLDDDTDPEDIP